MRPKLAGAAAFGSARPPPTKKRARSLSLGVCLWYWDGCELHGRRGRLRTEDINRGWYWGGRERARESERERARAAAERVDPFSKVCLLC